jgi:hypothetical protein
MTWAANLSDYLLKSSRFKALALARRPSKYPRADQGVAPAGFRKGAAQSGCGCIREGIRKWVASSLEKVAKRS